MPVDPSTVPSKKLATNEVHPKKTPNTVKKAKNTLFDNIISSDKPIPADKMKEIRNEVVKLLKAEKETIQTKSLPEVRDYFGVSYVTDTTKIKDTDFSKLPDEKDDKVNGINIPDFLSTYQDVLDERGEDKKTKADKTEDITKLTNEKLFDECIKEVQTDDIPIKVAFKYLQRVESGYFEKKRAEEEEAYKRAQAEAMKSNEESHKNENKHADTHEKATKSIEGSGKTNKRKADTHEKSMKSIDGSTTDSSKIGKKTKTDDKKNSVLSNFVDKSKEKCKEAMKKIDPKNKKMSQLSAQNTPQHDTKAR